MRRDIALAWKQWRQLRWFLALGLAGFAGLPAISAALRYLKHGEDFLPDLGHEMIWMLGAPMAIIIGTAAAAPDMRDDLRAFWGSRPISLTTWLLTGYLIGLVIVVLLCILPPAVDAAALALTHEAPWFYSYGLSTMAVVPFAAGLVYSIAFLLACTVRRASHAALLSYAAGLLVLFMPLVMPPLGSLSVLNLLAESGHVAVRPADVFGSLGGPPAGLRLPFSDLYLSFSRQYYTFAGVMAAACVLVLALTRLAVGRVWRVDAGQRVVCWTGGLVVLVLFGATALQIGSNLPVRHTIAMGPPGSAPTLIALSVQASGHGGVVLLQQRQSSTAGRPPEAPAHFLRAVEMADGSPSLGPLVPVAREPSSATAGCRLLCTAASPNRAYVLLDETNMHHGEPGVEPETLVLELLTVALDGADGDPVIGCLDLLDAIPEPASFRPLNSCAYGGRLYLGSTERTVVVDLSDPDTPRVAHVVDREELRYYVTGSPDGPDRTVELRPLPLPDRKEFRHRVSGRPDGPERTVELRLLPLPDLTPRERLAVGLQLGLVGTVEQRAEGDLVVVAGREDLTTYRVTEIDEERAVLEMAGCRRATPLERYFARGVWDMVLRDGLAYVVRARSAAIVTVYDLRDPERPTLAGHYAAPKEQFDNVVVLPDGRAMLANRELHVIGLPRRLAEGE